MVPEVVGSLDRVMAFFRRTVEDLSGAELVEQPPGVSNHAAWTLGHAAYSCQAIAGELGVSAWLPVSWEVSFGTGSVPSPRAGDYPDKAVLLATLDDARDRLRAALLQAGERGLAAPLPDVRYREELPTVGHAVTHVVGGHLAYHAGQLSVWRGAIGREPVAGVF